MRILRNKDKERNRGASPQSYPQSLETLCSHSNTKVRSISFSSSERHEGGKTTWTTSASDSLLKSKSFSVPGTTIQLGSVREGTSRHAGIGAENPGRGLAGEELLLRINPHAGICLGTAWRLASEPGIRQSSHPQPLTAADVGEREQSCTESLEERHGPNVVHTFLPGEL